MSDDQQKVLTERRGSVLVITLNNPERLNSWSGPMGAQYFGALDAAAADPEIRAVVLTGAGKGFCAGADMGHLEEVGEAGETNVNAERPITYPLSFPKPLIVAINGAAAGMGLVQSTMGDVRFAEPGVKMTTAFAKLGLIAEHGVSWLLPRIVGTSHALDLLMSSRVITSDRAYEMGLVNFISAPGKVVDEAVAYAQQLADSVSPRAIAVMKKQVYDHFDKDFAASFEESNTLMNEAIATGEITEGVAAFNERRAPKFTGLSA
ncbi:enoyl-CoA hydratase-related protein [Cumulibacter soli]|uniref:enoyl-CoA hydratase-related protein n=1 Tax=Cumulibacter soli TaxID=2546344 RepID=UPI0010687FB6|nr:enoyl-CoA hydratase-related protein [Cumulibacter soli]